MIKHRIVYGAETDRGRRKNNEDKELAIELDPQSPNSYLLAVADGMGGGVAGEEASATVIDGLQSYIKEHLKGSTEISELKGILNKAYLHAQEKVRDRIGENPDLDGMGTTLTALLVHKNHYVWGNIGDSRLYRLTQAGVEQLTKDHSHIQELIDKGEEPEMAYIRKYSNLITRCISGSIEEPDIYPNEMDESAKVPDAVELKSETALLLCSDGLLTFHPEAEISESIEKIYFSSKILKQVFEDLIQYAKDAGSRDNITVAALEYGIVGRKRVASPPPVTKVDISKPAPPPAKKRTPTKKLRTRLAISIPVLLIAGAVIAALIFSRPEDTTSEMLTKKAPCEWDKQIIPEPSVTAGYPEVRVGSYNCPEDSARILLIIELPGNAGVDTLEDIKNKGVINMADYRRTYLNETLSARTIAILRDSTIITGNSARILIR